MCVCSLLPTFGHTPGHVSVNLSSQGQKALISGDFIHYPIQMARLDLVPLRADADVVTARNTRIRVLDSVADQDILFFGTHFPTPSVGHVKRDGAVFRFQVLPVPA